MTFIKIGLLAAILLLSACQTAYRSNGLTGGHSSTQLDEDKFLVYFRGNGFTSSEKVTDLALLRCAEIAKKNGYKYFEILDSKNAASTAYISTPQQSQSQHTLTSYGNNLYGVKGSTTSGSQTLYPVNRHNTSILIQLSNDKTAASLNSEFISKSIKKKYNIY